VIAMAMMAMAMAAAMVSGMVGPIIKPSESILGLRYDSSGQHLEPSLIDIFFENIDVISRSKMCTQNRGTRLALSSVGRSDRYLNGEYSP